MKPSELNVGDVFYECQSGLNIKCEVITKPVEGINLGKKYWSWVSKNVFTEELIDYGLTEGFEYYGPRIYNEPQYISIVEGQLVFKFVGEIE